LLDFHLKNIWFQPQLRVLYAKNELEGKGFQIVRFLEEVPIGSQEWIYKYPYIFFWLSYLVYSQIWLTFLLDDTHFNYITIFFKNQKNTNTHTHTEFMALLWLSLIVFKNYKCKLMGDMKIAFHDLIGPKNIYICGTCFFSKLNGKMWHWQAKLQFVKCDSLLVWSSHSKHCSLKDVVQKIGLKSPWVVMLQQ